MQKEYDIRRSQSNNKQKIANLLFTEFECMMKSGLYPFDFDFIKTCFPYGAIMEAHNIDILIRKYMQEDDAVYAKEHLSEIAESIYKLNGCIDKSRYTYETEKFSYLKNKYLISSEIESLASKSYTLANAVLQYDLDFKFTEDMQLKELKKDLLNQMQKDDNSLRHKEIINIIWEAESNNDLTKLNRKKIRNAMKQQDRIM